MIELSVFISPAISALCAFAGSWFAFTNRLTRVETKLDAIEKKQDKYNDVIHRTFVVEHDVKNIYHDLSEVKEEIHHYHQ